MSTPSSAYLAEVAAYTAPPPPLSLSAASADIERAPSGANTALTMASDYIPGLFTLGSTYNVLNGKYADARSALQQVVDWNKSTFG